jgi:hypothetical protein
VERPLTVDVKTKKHWQVQEATLVPFDRS